VEPLDQRNLPEPFFSPFGFPGAAAGVFNNVGVPPGLIATTTGSVTPGATGTGLSSGTTGQVTPVGSGINTAGISPLGANLFNSFFGSTIPTAPGAGGTTANLVPGTIPPTFSSAVAPNTGLGLFPGGSPTAAFSPFGVNGITAGGQSTGGANGTSLGGGITNTGAGTTTTTAPGTTGTGTGTGTTTTTTGQFGPVAVPAFDPTSVFALFFGGQFR